MIGRVLRQSSPEQVVDLKVLSREVGEVSWQSMQSDDRFGMVDLSQPYPGYLKEVTAYAYHDFSRVKSVRSIEAGMQERLEDMAQWGVYLGRDEYHRELDQYILPAELKGFQQLTDQALSERTDGRLDSGMGISAPGL